MSQVFVTNLNWERLHLNETELKKAKMAMGKCGSGLTALCRGLIKGLNGDLGACARKCFLVFIKVGKMRSFVFEMPLSSSRGVSKWTPRSGEEIVPCGAQSVLNRQGGIC